MIRSCASGNTVRDLRATYAVLMFVREWTQGIGSWGAVGAGVDGKAVSARVSQPERAPRKASATARATNVAWRHADWDWLSDRLIHRA